MSDVFNFEALNASHNSPYPAIEWVHGSGFKLILNLPDYAQRNLAAITHEEAFGHANASPDMTAWAASYASGHSGVNADVLAKAMTVAEHGALATMPRALSFFTQQTFWSTVALTLMALSMLVFHRRRADQLVPAGRIGHMMEAIVLYIRDDVVRPNIPHHPDDWTPFLTSLFLMLLTCNLFGIIPLFATATGSFAVTVAFALPIFALMVVLGMVHNGAGGFWFKLVPVKFGWNPMDASVFILLLLLEWMSLLIKPAVLAIRLFANMLAGHTLLLVFASLGFIVYAGDPTNIAMTFGLGAFGWVIAVAFYFLELLVALVQAYVFVMLSAVFIGSCIHPEH